jgi:osmotically-inducible protein OsmY
MKLKFLAIAVILAAAAGIGCTNRNNAAPNSNISYSDSVKDALKQADLTDVNVSEDQDKNTITLSGKVHSEDAKAAAAKVAQTAGGSRIIVNELSVQPVGVESEAKDVAKNVDAGIEKNYEAALISEGLNKEHINYDATNGVLKLTGSVKSVPQRTEAQKLAQSVPNVQQVVNEIAVKR